MINVSVLRVFPNSKTGGNPAPIVLNAEGMSDFEMKQIAEQHGLESVFVQQTDPSSCADYHFRFFVPEHEMEMCGHATIGALWLLREKNQIEENSLLIETQSGLVRACVPKNGSISISQPKGVVEAVPLEKRELVLNILGITNDDLAQLDIVNACTSRVKTLIALKSRKALDALAPDFDMMKALCTTIGSTGLYPFAKGDMDGLFHARQFPRSSGYPEDAATGIAASALAFGLLNWGIVERASKVVIRQGEAMGRASEIVVTFDDERSSNDGCWVHGICEHVATN